MTLQRLELAGPYIFTVDSVLSPEECQPFIDATERLGFADAPITTHAGFAMRPDIRNNTRVMIDRPDWAAQLWARVRDVVPPFQAWQPSGINERFRCYRYDPGQRFAPHFDGYFQRPDGLERSVYTLMVYLNEGYEGGETRFQDAGIDVTPRTGRALFFYHHQLHEGSEVISGRKYVLRTDVMCRRG